MIEAIDLRKRYGTGPEATQALRGVTFSIGTGEFVAIIGPSGSGKTTLLNVIGALDRPTSGRLLIDGIDVSKLSNNELAAIRNRKLGFVFQDFNLISRMSTIENVELPLLIAGVQQKERRIRAMDLLNSFGIASKAHRSVTNLSGGERQRVAVARALAADPPIVLADEPTGNLDSQNTEGMMEMMRRLNEDYGKTLVIITHNPEVASRAKRIIAVRDGKIEKESRNN